MENLPRQEYNFILLRSWQKGLNATSPWVEMDHLISTPLRNLMLTHWAGNRRQICWREEACMGLLPWKGALCAEIWNGNSIYLGSQWTFSLIYFISTMIALSKARFEIKSIYPFTTMLLYIFFPQWLHWSHEAWHDRIIHPHTLVYWNVFSHGHYLPHYLNINDL